MREMRDSGIPWIGEIPKEWQVNMLSSLFDEHKQKNKDLAETNLLSLSYGKIVRKDINTKEGLLPESFDGYNVISRGDIVFRLTDLQNDKRSLRTGLCLEKGIITSAYVTIRERAPLNSSYFHYLLHSYDLCKVFYGMGDGVRQGMNYSDLRKLLLLQPSLAEQQRIAEFLDRKCAEVDEMIGLQEQIIEELKAYKQSVITEAVTKGLNPAAPMRDSGIEWIGQIPAHWSKDKIIRAFRMIGSGTTPKSTDESNFDGDINWIQSGDINGGIMSSCKNRVSNETVANCSALKVYSAPFIIVAMYGASVGNTSISTIDGCVNQACCVLGSSALNFSYAFSVIKSCKDYWLRKAVGGGQPNISQDTIKQTWIPIPPLAEQQAIADYLDEKCADIDSLIQTKLSKIDSLKEYKKSIIYEYVTSKREVVL